MRILMAAMLALASTTGLGCAEAECEATGLRVTYGSDVAGEDDEVVCEALPNACTDSESATCECLEGQQLPGGVNADFCLEQGACTIEDGILNLTCPGG